jgi:hypothetical protein
MSDQHVEFEEIEQIPWSALAAKTADPWSRTIPIIAGVVAVVAIGLLAGRLLSSGDGATIVALPQTPAASPASATTTPAAAASSVEPDAVPVATTAASPAVAVYSEADLMAISVEDETRLAVMRAEWLVRDYFTVDGDEITAGELASLIGDLAIPHQEAVGYSYVEWARAFAVASPSPGRYMVDVAFRSLVPSGATGFARTDVRAVTVTLDVDVDGGTMLVDLPSPVALPPTLPIPDRVGESVVASDEITAAALQLAAEAGSDPSVLTVTRDGDVWRFLMEIGDDAGNRWPVVVATKNP